MRSSKTLLYGLLARVGVLARYFYTYRILPSREEGLIGLFLGLAGGVYLDRSRSERDLGDNLAAGLLLGALLRALDIHYMISTNVPSSYRLAFITLSVMALGAALSAESSKGRPARIPILGLIAILVAFVLVFSSVTTTTVSLGRYSGGSITTGTTGYDKFEAYAKYVRINGTDIIYYLPPSFPVPNDTAYTLVLTYTDSVGVTADKVLYVYIPIRCNRSVFTNGSDAVLKPGDKITIELTFSENVSVPKLQLLYVLPDGSRVEGDYVDGDASTTVSEYNATLELSTTIKLAYELYVIVDWGPLGLNNYPSVPLTLTITRKVTSTQDVSTTYLLGALGAMIVAIIDALPLDAKTVRRRKRRKKARR